MRLDGLPVEGFEDDPSEWVSRADAERCRYCGFLVVPVAAGVACKSGSACPFHPRRVEYVDQPPKA